MSTQPLFTSHLVWAGEVGSMLWVSPCCSVGSQHSDCKWFYQNVFLVSTTYFHSLSCSYLKILWIGICNQHFPSTVSIDSVYFGMCLYSPVSAFTPWHTNLIKTKTFQGGRISWINEGQWAIKEGWNKIILKPQRSIILGRADMRVSQLQLGGGRRLVILETADIEHHWDRDVTNTNPAM